MSQSFIIFEPVTMPQGGILNSQGNGMNESFFVRLSLRSHLFQDRIGIAAT
jgi:hypothetical protein